MRSIRSYLLSRLLGGAALVLVCAGLVVYLVVRRSLEAQFDKNLADRVQGFASILFQDEDEVEFEFSDELMPEYDADERPDYFELWFDDGRLLERSNSLAGADLAVPGTPGSAPAHWTAPLPNGREGRFVAQIIEVHHVYPEEGPDRPEAARILVVVARGREELVAAEREVLWSCVAFALVLIGLIAAFSWIAVERGLAPAKRLALTLDAIQVDRLPARLEAGELPAELVPMASKTDALIRRVAAALKRERRTSADIAHELRTPISELLTVSEVELRNGQDPQSAHRALETVRDVAWRMGRSVATLLKLARLEMGAETFDREEVDMKAVVSELLRPLAALARERGIRVQDGIAPGSVVEGDGEVLRIVVSNLLSNALYYSPRSGNVACRLEGSRSDWRLSVENEAPDLRPEDLRFLTDPFWKKDRARADRSRSGLGLSLSRARAEKAGMQLRFALDGRTFRAELVSRGRVEDGAARARRRAKS